MRKAALFGLVVAALLGATRAHADDKATCLDAASKGQRFRDTHKLVEARDALRVCAAAQCPAVVQSDCANWLADVERALPSVVLTAKTGAGADLADVNVTVDGQPLVTKLDGQALAINAGRHTFHFTEADGTNVDAKVVLREGEKNQAVAVVLGPVPLPPSSAQVEGRPVPTGRKPPWRTVGWALGGAGVVGLGVGTVFGIVAVADKSAAHCDANNVCDAGKVSGIKTAALVSDIGWIAGGVLLASGAALVLFTPKSGETGSIELAPVVTARGAAVTVGGAW